MTGVDQVLRGAGAARLLARAGIDARRFWLLMDLFDQLSERGEMMDQLGRNGVALKTIAWMYFAMSTLVSLLMVAEQISVASYAGTILAITFVFLGTILLSEAGNSLINPVEALVLAHQPINGATYTAAKAAHLLRIVMYIVPGLNAVPSIAALFLPNTPLWYPFAHLAASLVVGVVAALCCCAAVGWLVRFVPPQRLKMAGQLASTVPMMCMMWMGQIHSLARTKWGKWLPHSAEGKWTLGVSAAVVLAALLWFGLRTLSADYLLRVTSMVRSGSKGTKQRKSIIGGVVSRYFGGQASRGGFVFVSRMMMRDWQFRRHIMPLAIPIVFSAGGLIGKSDPFTRQFTAAHLLPHFIAMMLFSVCNMLPFSSDYKGGWLFLLAPSGALRGLARGVHAALWILLIVIPNILILPVFIWQWGLWHALLFTSWSVAAASMYLALELRLIRGIPFSRQADASASATMMGIVICGGLAMSAAVGVQYLLVFRSTSVVFAGTIVVAYVAWVVTRQSLGSLETAMRYHLGLASNETGALYREVEA